jgi:hypothetical protein
MAEQIDFRVKNGLAVATTATILGNTQSNSTTSGALLVKGGAGIGGNLHVGGEIVAQRLVIQLTTITTTVVQTDDVIQTLNVTNATSTITGALQVAGGVGIGRDVWIGGTLNVAGGINASITGISNTATNIAGGTTGQLVYQSSTGATAFVGPGTIGQILVSGGATIPVYTNTGTIYVGRAVLADTATTSTSAAIAYALADTSTTYVSRAVLADTATTSTSAAIAYALADTSTTYVSRAVLADTATTSTSAAIAYALADTSTTYVSRAVLADTATTSTSAAIAYALADTGTTYVSRAVLADAATTSTSAAIAYALADTGTTYVSRAVLADSATNIAGGTAGQLVYQSSTGTTAFVSTSSAGDVLVSNGTGAPTYNNTLILSGALNATSTITGALQVAGGVGVGRDLYVGGTIYQNGVPVGTGGTGGTATTSSFVQTVLTATSATYFLTFVDSNNTTSSSELLYTTSSVTVNPGAGIVEVNGNLYVGGYTFSNKSWVVKTSNYTAISGDKIIADSTLGSFTITLPLSPVTGNSVFFADKNDWSVNNVIVNRNGQTIENAAENLILDVKCNQVELIFDGTTWQVFPLTNAVTAALVNDNTNTATVYPLWVESIAGLLVESRISSSKLTFNPSTGRLSATDLNSLSDIRLKENVAGLSNALDIVEQLNPVKFTWKDTKNNAYGVIAQEIQLILPELVEEDTHTGLKSVSYTQLVPILLKAIQELKQQVDLLTRKG